MLSGGCWHCVTGWNYWELFFPCRDHGAHQSFRGSIICSVPQRTDNGTSEALPDGKPWPGCQAGVVALSCGSDFWEEGWGGCEASLSHSSEIRILKSTKLQMPLLSASGSLRSVGHTPQPPLVLLYSWDENSEKGWGTKGFSGSYHQRTSKDPEHAKALGVDTSCPSILQL